MDLDIISQDAITKKEIKRKLGYSRACIEQINSVFWDRHITKHTKKTIYKTLIQRGY